MKRQSNKIERIKRHCFMCGHNRFFKKYGIIKNGTFCTKCGNPPMKFISYINKHKKERFKLVRE